MKFICLQTGRLLDRRHSGLSPAEGLRLEEHLSTCEPCRADANMLHGLSSLARDMTVQLSAPARERAIANALAATAVSQAPRAAPPRRLALLLAAAAVLVCFVIFGQRVSREDAKSVASIQHAEPADRVMSGVVQVSGSARAPGEPLASHAQLHTAGGAVVALAHARVELRANSDVSWDGPARTLSLQEGSVLIDVDPAKQRSFRVETQTFAVLVLGTRFEVTPSSVHVLQGRVSVTPKVPAGDAAPIVLTAGTDHSDFALQPSAAGEPQHIADLERTPRRSRSGPRAAPAHARAKPERTIDASALLEQARSQLAARDLVRARATLALAAPHLHGPELRAQALSLEAECELQARQFAAARDTYLQVARTFFGMPAAETALFAAARIEAEHGEPARALELLSSYLAKYPRGSFVREAERRMKLLPRAQAEHAR